MLSLLLSLFLHCRKFSPLGKFRDIWISKTLGLLPTLTIFFACAETASAIIAVDAQAYKTDVRGGTEAVFWDPGYQRNYHDLRNCTKAPEGHRRTTSVFVTYIVQTRSPSRTSLRFYMPVRQVR